MNNDMKAVIAAAAKKCGSYYALASKLNITKGAVYRWKSGKKNPNGKHLIEMMKIAGKLLIVGAIAAAIVIAPEAAIAGGLYIMLSRATVSNSRQTPPPAAL